MRVRGSLFCKGGKLIQTPSLKWGPTRPQKQKDVTTKDFRTQYRGPYITTVGEFLQETAVIVPARREKSEIKQSTENVTAEILARDVPRHQRQESLASKCQNQDTKHNGVMPTITLANLTTRDP